MMLNFIDYNLLDKAYQIFYDGWEVVIDPNYLNTGITFCKDKLIVMGVWDLHLWAHELTHVFYDCIRI